MMVDFPDPEGPVMTINRPLTSGEFGQQRRFLPGSQAPYATVLGNTEGLHEPLGLHLAGTGHGGKHPLDLRAGKDLVGLGLLEQLGQP